ncbi:BACON domain-containing protein, partial [Spirosoma endophyticum]
MKKIVYTLFIFLLSNLAYSQVAGTDASWSFYPDGYVIYNNDGSINRYHAKLQFSGSNQNIVTDLLWDQLPCGGVNAKKVWWINEDHSGDQNYYGFQTSRPENIVHEFGGDFTYHCGCTTTNPNDWSLYGSPQGFTNIIEVPYHIKKFDTDSPNYIIKPSTFHWNKNSLEVQTFKGGLIPPIGAGTIEQYGKINLHTGMLPKSVTDHNTVMSYGLSYLNAKNMPNLPVSKRYVTANDGEWATNWNNCNSTLPYPQAGCIAGYQFNHMTTQQAWDTYGTNLSSKSNYGVVLQDGEFWNGNIDSQGLTNYKYVFDRVIQNGSTTLFGQHHSQPYYTDRFFHDPSGGTDAGLWNAKYNVSATDRYSLVNFNYISAYWQKVIANNTSVADDWKIASLQTYTQDMSPTNMYAWIQDLEINKKLFPEWKHLLTVEGFHETPYFATVSHTLPTGGAITFTGGQSQWVKQSSSLQEFTGLYSNTIGDGVCYFSDNYTRNDDKSNWIKEDGNTQYPGADVYARQFYGVDDYLYLGIWKANEVNRQTVGQTWSKPDISVDGGSTWITGTALLPASAYTAKHPLVHIINTTAGGKIIMAYNMWNPAYKVQTIKVRDANGVISDVQLKGQFPTLYKYGETTDNYLSVSPAAWSAPSAGGSTTASLSASGAWSITTVPAWLTLSPTTGNGSATLTLTAAANTASDRTATLTINGPAGTTQSITVTQAGITNSLSVSPANWSASTSGGSQLITVSSNVAWSVNTNGTSWLSVNTASGSNNGTFTLTAAANSGSARSATLSVTGGGLTQTITVTQQGSTSTTEVICLEAESGSGNRTPSSGSQASAGQYVGGFGVSAEFMSYA